MGKKRKKGRKLPKYSQVSFDMEPDADQMFLDFIENFSPTKDDKKLSEESPKKGRSNRSNSDTKKLTIDLHGYSSRDAIQEVDRVIGENLDSSLGEVHLKIITGKGRHSGADGPVLAGEVYNHIKRTYRDRILKIDENPDLLRLNGVLIRGHFEVVMV